MMCGGYRNILQTHANHARVAILKQASERLKYIKLGMSLLIAEETWVQALSSLSKRSRVEEWVESMGKQNARKTGNPTSTLALKAISGSQADPTDVN
jgi:hypothetical protein